MKLVRWHELVLQNRNLKSMLGYATLNPAGDKLKTCWCPHRAGYMREPFAKCEATAWENGSCPYH